MKPVPSARDNIRDPDNPSKQLQSASEPALILRRHERDQDPLGPDARRLRHRARLRLGGDGMGGVEARLPAATRPAMVRGLRLAGLPSAGLLLVVVRLRRLCAAISSSRAPTSPRPAASPRSPSPSACRSGGRARRRRVTTYGSARWAETQRGRERRPARRRTASCSAGWRDDYLRHDGPEHVLCFAPTRSGKGVGLVVPTLLTWPGSAHRPRHQGRELDADRRLARAVRPRAAVRSDQRAERRLQSAAGSAPRRMGGARRPEHRRRPGRSRRRAGAAEPLGEDQPLAAGRRHPARPLRRAGQDARRRRRLPLRSASARSRRRCGR